MTSFKSTNTFHATSNHASSAGNNDVTYPIQSGGRCGAGWAAPGRRSWPGNIPGDPRVYQKGRMLKGSHVTFGEKKGARGISFYFPEQIWAEWAALGRQQNLGRTLLRKMKYRTTFLTTVV